MHAKKFKYGYTEDGSKLRECPTLLRHYLINNCKINENINYDKVVDKALSYNNIDINNLQNYSNKKIKRIIVNHIRHQETPYNENLRILNDVTPRSRKDYTYKQIKNVTLYNIKKQFPWLADACDEQHYPLPMIKDLRKKNKKKSKTKS